MASTSTVFVMGVTEKKGGKKPTERFNLTDVFVPCKTGITEAGKGWYVVDTVGQWDCVEYDGETNWHYTAYKGTPQPSFDWLMDKKPD